MANVAALPDPPTSASFSFRERDSLDILLMLSFPHPKSISSSKEIPVLRLEMTAYSVGAVRSKVPPHRCSQVHKRGLSKGFTRPEPSGDIVVFSDINTRDIT